MGGILLSLPGLVIEPRQLRKEYRSLKLGHPPIIAIADIGEAGIRLSPSLVVKAAADVDQPLLAADDDATLAGVEVL